MSSSGRVDAGTRHARLAAGGDDDGRRGRGRGRGRHAASVGGAATRAARGARRVGGYARPAMTHATSPRPRKPRVAIVFGGRSSEHAVSCATAAGRAARDRPRRATTSCPIGIARDGRWVLVADDPAPLELTAGPRARGRRRRRRRGRAAEHHRPRADGPRAGQVAARAGRGRRRVPVAARAVRRGRHPPGHARAGRHPLRRVRRARLRGGDGQALHEGGVRRRRAAGRARTS